MNITCQFCRSVIALEDVNVANDLALCRSCGKTSPFSEIASGPESGGPDLASPPAGAWFEQLAGGFRVGASTRSWRALLVVPFTCVWAGLSLTTIYGKQLAAGHFDLKASSSGIPFLIGSIVLIVISAMSLAGKVELSRSGDALTVFYGVGSVGRSRSYAWSDFRIAREIGPADGWKWNREQGQSIVLEGRRRVVFGTLLTDERRYFVLAALRKMLRESNPAAAPPPPKPVFR